MTETGKWLSESYNYRYLTLKNQHKLKWNLIKRPPKTYRQTTLGEISREGIYGVGKPSVQAQDLAGDRQLSQGAAQHFLHHQPSRQNVLSLEGMVDPSYGKKKRSSPYMRSSNEEMRPGPGFSQSTIQEIIFL